MYIMVEDEFYAIAQQFTRHLHHAEYVRRRKLAKRVNVSVLRGMERPTDGRTAMSEQTLKRKEAERLRERQKQGLKPRVRRPRTDTEEEVMSDNDPHAEVEEEEEEEEREDDPWYGTSLHTLMASPRRNRSLVGLQSIRSSTRAAAGFVRSAELGRPLNNDRAGRSEYSFRRDEQQQQQEEPASPSSDEDDDLEIIESRSSRPNPLPQSDVRVRTRLIKEESPTERDIKPILQRNTSVKREPNDDNSRRVTISGDIRLNNGDDNLERRRTSLNGNMQRTATAQKQVDSHTINTRPRKRIFIDELDDVVTTDIKREDEESKNDIVIQGQPRRLSSTAKESRSTTYRTSGQRQQQQQQQKTDKKPRLTDIPTFLV